MKIMVVAPGLTWHVVPWVQGLAARGHQILVADMTPLSGEWEHETFSVEQVGNPGRLDRLGGLLTVVPRQVSKLRSLATSFRPDLVHIMSATPRHAIGLFTRVAPIVLTAFGAEVLEAPRRSIRSKVTLWMMGRRVDAVTADSQHVLDEFARRTRTHAMLRRIYWGVDVNMYRPDLETGRLREQLVLGDGPVILSPRRLDWYYRHEVILEAAAQIVARQPEARIVFKFGDGDPGNLIRTARALGLADVVRFVGYIPDSDMPSYYALADLLVSIPSFDSTPRAVFEGMACGAIPVVSDLPWVRETLLRNGVNCRVVPVGDPTALAGAALDLMSRQDTDAIRESNRAYVTAEMSADAMLDRLEEVYRSVMRVGQARPSAGTHWDSP